jgi:hypothetical protein
VVGFAPESFIIVQPWPTLPLPSSAIQPPGTNPSASTTESENPTKSDTKAFEDALAAQTKGKKNPSTAADQKQIAPDKNPKMGSDKWQQEIQAVINEGV